MPSQPEHSDDDGRTIADVSALGDPAPEPLRPDSRDVRGELGSPESRRMVILGTLGAGLSLGAVYVIIFGIAIALMVVFWT